MQNKPIIGSIEKGIVASDLLDERAKCNFDQNEFQNLIWNKDTVDYYNEIVATMESDPILKNSHKYYDMTREEQMLDSMKKIRRGYELQGVKFFFKTSPGANEKLWNAAYIGLPSLYLHYTMFYQTLENLTSEEQYREWVPKALNLKILGCYAQTELGHGTNVAGLETTATFDKQTDEFVIHTPSISATKWWPGEMGGFTNYALVYANLLIEGKSYGVCPFLVQIRSLEDHMPMPGVKSGDLGPKLGYNSKDNGWLTFDHVRIPRTQMLMRYSMVTRDGQFKEQGDKRMLYSIMLGTRVIMVKGAMWDLQKGLLIGLRYSAVRRQFVNIEKSQETKILDYQTQQMKLFPLFAISVAQGISYNFVDKMYRQLLEDSKNQKFHLLDQLHHFTSGMKSVYTCQTVNGLMLVRQSLGGAGYTVWSGLPQIILDHTPAVTYEGDNTVMAQQSARYLFKQVTNIKRGKKSFGIHSYLNEAQHLLMSGLQCKCTTPEDFISLKNIDEALKVNICYLVFSTHGAMMKNPNETLDQKNNSLYAIDVVKMSQTNIKYIQFKLFMDVIEHEGHYDGIQIQCTNLKEQMKYLCALVGLTHLIEDCKACYEIGYFGKNSQKLMNQALKLLLEKIRPQIIPLIESFKFPDSVLVSAIGNSYGDIYETHLKWAKESKLNQQTGNIPVGFMQNIMPIIQGKL